MDVPILGVKPADGPQLDDGKEHAAVVYTSDGRAYIVAGKFPAPRAADGSIDLGKMKDFNPAAQLGQNIMQLVARHAAFAAVGPAGADYSVLPTIGNGVVMPGHVVSFRYLGTVERRHTESDPYGRVIQVDIRTPGSNGRPDRIAYITLDPDSGELQ